MDVDLTDPVELDWLARGKSGAFDRERFEAEFPESEREQIAGNEIVTRLTILLIEFDTRSPAESEYSDYVLDAREVFGAFDDEDRTEIKQRHWTDLEDELTGTSFLRAVYQRTAEELLGRYVAAVRNGGTDPTRKHLAAVIDRGGAERGVEPNTDDTNHKYSVDS